MPKNAKAGRALEILTARIEAAVSASGVVIKSPDHLADKVAGGTREVDVSLRATVGSAEVVVIVECRDRGRVADVTWIEQIASKRDAVGAAKAIAVSSGTFSKKALSAAKAHGIDARTLAQVNNAEVKRWTGNLQIFMQSSRLVNVSITVVLGGSEPLAREVTEGFDELVRDQGFDASFIALAGQEGVLSPIEVIGRTQSGPEIPQGGPITVTLPPKSSVVISANPVLAMLVGATTEVGSPRSHLIEFPDGDAFLSIEGAYRTLRSVRLNFTVEHESRVRLEGEAYRYSSSKGLIEVAARTADLGGGQLSIVEHR